MYTSEGNLHQLQWNSTNTANIMHWNLTSWLWVKMTTLQQKYFPWCTVYVLSDLHLLFSLKTLSSAIERVSCKHRKEAKAGISHLLMLTQMGRTVLMYCWGCCCIGIYIRYFWVYHFSFRTALEFDAMMQGGRAFLSLIISSLFMYLLYFQKSTNENPQ